MNFMVALQSHTLSIYKQLGCLQSVWNREAKMLTLQTFTFESTPVKLCKYYIQEKNNILNCLNCFQLINSRQLYSLPREYIHPGKSLIISSKL